MNDNFPWGWMETATPYDELFGYSDADMEGGEDFALWFLSGDNTSESDGAETL